MTEKAGKYFIRNQVPKKGPIALVDFDGVIHSYTSGWDESKEGETWIPDAPVDGAKEGLEELKRLGYQVVIFTSRAKSIKGIKAVRNWMTANNLYCDQIVLEKIPAVIMIDDRAVTFRGNWFETLQEIKNFKPWTKQRSKSIMTVLMGNVGTGKSTYARSFEDAVIVSMDSIITAVEGSYNYRNEHRTIYHSIEHTAIETALKNDVNVIIDRTCMTRSERKRFIDMAKRFNAKVECVDFGKGDDESLKRRVESDDDRDYSSEKWHEIHEMMQEKYEKPELDEGFIIVQDGYEKPEYETKKLA